MVAHAPCEHATHDQKTTFWTHFSAAVGKLKTDRASRRIVFIDGNAQMSADEPFVGACDLEPCNDNGERSIAAMKVDGVVAVDTWYPCGCTWRSAKGHTSRVDYVLYDASLVEEIKTCGHTVDLACGSAEDHRCVKCSIEVKGETHIENNRKKESTSTHLRCKIHSIVLSFKEDFGHLPRRLEKSVSDHAEELSGFLLKHARDVFGVKERKPRQPWISHGTWCTVKVTAPVRRLANQAGRVWTICENEVLLCSVDGFETMRVFTWRSPAGTSQGMEGVWNALRVADKLAFLEWNAKEAHRLASNGDSHGMYCSVPALARRTQNGVASPVHKQDGTRGDEERELQWQEHFARVFG